MRFLASPRPLVALALLALACGAAQAPAAAVPEAERLEPAASPPKPKPITAANVAKVSLRWEAAAGGFGRAVAIDRARGRVISSSGTPLRVFELATGKRLRSFPVCDDVLRGGMLAAPGGKLVVVCQSGVHTFDSGTFVTLPGVEANESKITAAGFAWPRLALGHHDGVVRIYDFEAGGLAAEIPVPGPPIDVKSIALSPDGKTVAVAWTQGSIWWWKTDQPTDYHKLVRHENESDTLAFSDDGQLLAEEGKTHFTSVWRFGADPDPVVELENGAWVKRILFTRDGQWLVRGGSDGLELTEIRGPKRIALDNSGKVEDIALDAAGSLIAAIDRAGRLTLWGVK